MGANTVPLACMPCGGCVPRGWWRSGHRPHSVVPLRAAAAYCGGGGEGVPGCLPPMWGASEFRRFPLSGCPPLGGLPGPATRVLWARVCECGAQHWPLGSHAPCGAACCRGGGGPSPGGWPSTIARRVRCQALSLPLPVVLWDRRPGFRDPCVLGAVGSEVGAQHLPHALQAVDARRGGSGGASPGGAVRRCVGRLRSGAPPPLAARPSSGLSGSAPHVLWARVCGCGGPALSSWLARPVGAVCRGGGGGPSPGGQPATAVRGVWCQALSLPRPLVLRGGQPGFRDPCVPGAVGVGAGTQHRPHSDCRCGLALPAVGLAEGRPSLVARAGALSQKEMKR